MTRADLDAPRTNALDTPFAVWLVLHSTACPRCKGPRAWDTGCDHCGPRQFEGTTRRLINALYGEDR